jgi:hypothetical protein
MLEMKLANFDIVLSNSLAPTIVLSYQDQFRI